MKLQFSNTICSSFFTAGWNVVTIGNSLSAVLCFWNFLYISLDTRVLHFQASFKVCKGLFKCCFSKVCSKQSYCFAFDKASFLKGKAKTGLHGLPMWLLWLRHIIKAFKL